MSLSERLYFIWIIVNYEVNYLVYVNAVFETHPVLIVQIFLYFGVIVSDIDRLLVIY